ncbi:hypothetical protein HK405_006510, partial [Cladochytrium tenue]
HRPPRRSLPLLLPLSRPQPPQHPRRLRPLGSALARSASRTWSVRDDSADLTAAVKRYCGAFLACRTLAGDVPPPLPPRSAAEDGNEQAGGDRDCDLEAVAAAAVAAIMTQAAPDPLLTTTLPAAAFSLDLLISHMRARRPVHKCWWEQMRLRVDVADLVDLAAAAAASLPAAAAVVPAIPASPETPPLPLTHCRRSCCRLRLHPRQPTLSPPPSLPPCSRRRRHDSAAGAPVCHSSNRGSSSSSSARAARPASGPLFCWAAAPPPHSRPACLQPLRRRRGYRRPGLVVGLCTAAPAEAAAAATAAAASSPPPLDRDESKRRSEALIPVWILGAAGGAGLVPEWAAII